MSRMKLKVKTILGLLVLLINMGVLVVIAKDPPAGKCDTYPTPCSQLCSEKGDGGVTCSCVAGYQPPDENPSRCVAAKSDGKGHEWGKPVLIYDQGNHIGYNLIEKSVPFSQPFEIGGTFGMSSTVGALALDIRGGKVLYAVNNGLTHREPSEKTIIMSVGVDGSNNTVLFNQGFSKIVAMAMDFVGGALYVADMGRQELITCSLKSRQCSPMMKVNHVTSLAVNSLKRVVYWTDCDQAEGRVFKANLDGSDMGLLYKMESQVCISGLKLDAPVDVLYWIEEMETYIYSYHIPTGSLQKLERQTTAIAIFEDNIYFMYTTHEQTYNTMITDVYAEDKFKVNIEVRQRSKEDYPYTVQQHLVNQPRSIHIYHPVLQYTTDASPCDVKQCDHICVLKKDSGAKCVCGQGTILASDGKTCHSDWKFPALFILKDKEIVRGLPDILGAEKTVSIVTAPEPISAMAIDWVTKTLYYSINTTSETPSIYKLQLDAPRPKSDLLYREVGTVRRLVVDQVGQNLYWITTETGHISVGRLDGGGRIQLKAGDIDPTEIENIQIDTNNRKLYISVCGSKPQISECNMTVQSCKPNLFENDVIGCPRDLTLDPENSWLYWLDDRARKITRAHVVQLFTEPFRLSGQYRHMTVANGNVFWTESYMSGIQYAKKDSIQRNDAIYRHFDDLNDVIYVTSSDDVIRGGTSCNNCQHGVCVSGKTEHVCLNGEELNHVDPPKDSSRAAETEEDNRTEKERKIETESDIIKSIVTTTKSNVGLDRPNAKDCQCKNGGTCVDGKCRCPESFSGLKCEAKTLQASDSHQSSDEEGDNKVIYIGAAVVLIAVLAAVLVAVSVMCKRKRSRHTDGSSEEFKALGNSMAGNSIYEPSSGDTKSSSFSIPRAKIVTHTTEY